jgi:hypothetical protein
MKYLSALPALLLVFGAACSSSSGGGSSSQAASKLAPDVAIAWFDQLVDNIRVAGFSPPVASRAIGYSGVAAYECVVPGMPDHRSLGGQLNGLDELPELPSGQHDWPTVLNACLAELQRNLFATAPQAVLDAIDALERDVTVRLDGLSEAVVDRSHDRQGDFGPRADRDPRRVSDQRSQACRQLSQGQPRLRFERSEYGGSRGR